MFYRPQTKLSLPTAVLEGAVKPPESVNAESSASVWKITVASGVSTHYDLLCAEAFDRMFEEFSEGPAWFRGLEDTLFGPDNTAGEFDAKVMRAVAMKVMACTVWRVASSYVTRVRTRLIPNTVKLMRLRTGPKQGFERQLASLELEADSIEQAVIEFRKPTFVIEQAGVKLTLAQLNTTTTGITPLEI